MKAKEYLVGIVLGTILATLMIGEQALHAGQWVEAGCPGYEGGCLEYQGRTPRLVLLASAIVAYPFAMLWVTAATWPRELIEAAERLERALP